MKECVRIIDNMDMSDSEKIQLHKDIMQAKRDFLTNVGDMMKSSVREDISPYVEHTHNGINLRIVPREKKSVKEIKAIAEYSGLNLVSENKTNSNSNLVWLRFTVE